MTKLLRKLAIVVGSAAVSVGLMAAVATPADASTHMAPTRTDSSWGY